MSVVYVLPLVKFERTWKVVDDPSGGGTASAWTTLASGPSAAPLLRAAAATARSRCRRIPSKIRCACPGSAVPDKLGTARRDDATRLVAAAPGGAAVKVKFTRLSDAVAVANCGTTR